MKGLVDGDIIVFRCGFAAERTMWHLHVPSKDYTKTFEYKKDAEEELDKLLPGKYSRVEGEDYMFFPEVVLEPIQNAYNNINTVMNKIKEACHLSDFDIEVCLSPWGSKTFRHRIATTRPYKGNRKKEHRPTYEKELRDYLIGKWQTTVADDEEADDLLAIKATAAGPDEAIIITIDKDLDQVPGLKYNFTKDEAYTVTEAQATYNFHMQLLTGDATDNIVGLPGIGPGKAAKALHGLETEEEQFAEVCRMYQIHSGKEDWQEYLREQGRLLYIRRQPEEMWDFVYDDDFDMPTELTLEY